MERLAELEITVGCRREPLSYCPDTSVTRGQMATFLVRAFDVEPAGSAGFVDTEGSAHEANIDALAAAGITVGCQEEPLQFCTSDPVRRSQMATFVARALGLVETPTTTPTDTNTQQPAQDTDTSTEPTVAQPPLPPNAYRAIGAGARHTCGLRVNGTIDCWGADYEGPERHSSGNLHRSDGRLLAFVRAAHRRHRHLLGQQQPRTD